VHSVAQAHHGRFFISSQGKGQGARAILTLPANIQTPVMQSQS